MTSKAPRAMILAAGFGTRLGELTALRYPERECRVRHDVLGEAAVTVPAGEPRSLAKVLPALDAELAPVARAAQPGQPGAVAGGPALHSRPDGRNGADCLVPGSDRQPARFEVALRQLQVGPANRAGGHPDEDFSMPRFGARDVKDMEWLIRNRCGFCQPRGAHLIPRRLARAAHIR